MEPVPLLMPSRTVPPERAEIQPADRGAPPEQDGGHTTRRSTSVTEGERELEQLERFLAHAAGSPKLRSRLKGADPYEVVEIAAAAGFRFGVFTLHRSVCTGYVMPHFR